MKYSFVALVALLAFTISVPAQAQTLAFNYQSNVETQLVNSPSSSVPQVLVEDSYLSLEKEHISTTLFSKFSYPRMAAKAGITADCQVEFVVYKDAQIGKIEAIGKSCDYFVDEIKKNIESFRWMPALEDGNAVDFAVKTEIQFRLK